MFGAAAFVSNDIIPSVSAICRHGTYLRAVSTGCGRFTAGVPKPADAAMSLALSGKILCRDDQAILDRDTSHRHSP
jgi:hypothetical protein